MKTFIEKNLKTFAFAAFAFLFWSNSAYAQIKIMPMGDSITRGGHGNPGGRYRAELAQALTNQGVVFEYEGEFNDIAGRHQGTSGWSIEQMTRDYGQSVSLRQPDLVLLLAGTNNHFNPSVVSEFVERYSDLLDMIHSNAPNAQVVMSTVPKFAYDRPNTQFWTDAFVDNRNEVTFPVMNAAICEVASQRDWVSVVDLFSVVDIETDYASDAVHLNLFGQQKLAALFEEAVVEFAANALIPGGDCNGDVNQDGIVNFLDISPFISALMFDEYVLQADVNRDGMVNFLDINPFIEILSQS